VCARGQHLCLVWGGWIGNRAIAYTFVDKVAEARQDTERAVELGMDRGELEAMIEEAKTRR